MTAFEGLCCSTASLLLVVGISQARAQPQGYQQGQGLDRLGPEGDPRGNGLQGSWKGHGPHGGQAAPQPLSSSRGIRVAVVARDKKE